MRTIFKNLSLLLCVFASVMCCRAAYAQDMPRWLDVYSNGTFKLDGSVYGQIVVYDDKWSPSYQSPQSMSNLSKGSTTVTGKFTLKGGKVLLLKQQTVPTGGSVDYSAQLKSPEGGFVANQVSLSFILPVNKFGGKEVTIDGKKVLLPAKFDETKFTVSSGSAKEIKLPLSGGLLSFANEKGIRYLFQDNRKFKGNSFSLRLMFSPSHGNITEAALKTKIAIKSFDAQVLDISKVANMGFADETAMDGKGGWTDQGKENDLRMIKPGKKTFSGVPFMVLNPKSNNGKGCIVLSDGKGKGLPSEVTLPVSSNGFNYLYLLHCAAWAKGHETYGQVTVDYNDGTKSELDVKGGRDVADWWGPYSLPNGAVVWTAENKSNYVGLYMSRFKIENKPIKSVSLKSTGGAMWMVVGISGMNDDVALPVEESDYYIVAGKDWKPIEHSLDVKKGSALDMSFLVDAPAGKYGRVIAKDGKFEFAKAPGKPIRFYGSNLCFSANYMDKKQAETLSENFVRYGYNSLRIHHHDQGMIDPSAPDSLTFDKAQIDKLDYLFYCMKQKGVYITTDIYISRHLKPEETGLYDKPSRRIKALVPASKLVMENIKAFSKKWLEHVNPYTGIAWKDDPALYAISFINENTMYSVWKSTPEVKGYYQQEMEKWVKENKIPYSSEAEKESAMSRFSTLMQIRSYTELHDYVKNVVGCKAVYSDCNMQAYRAQQIARSHFDYVDNHGYWDHPRFPVRSWSLPYGFHNMSVIKRDCSMPAQQMPSRIFGKPFTFTEYNYVFPNVYRSEGSTVMGAYAALQGWSAVYRFAFAHQLANATSVRPANGFDTATDPLALLGERIAALLFLRGDVREATGKVPYVMTDAISGMSGSGTNASGFGKDYGKLGLIHQVGTVVLNKGVKVPVGSLFCVGLEDLKPSQLGNLSYYRDQNNLLDELVKAGKLPTDLYQPKEDILRSDTGEITLEPTANRLAISTPRSESIVIPEGKSGKAKFLNVSGCTTYSTIFTASLDGKDLPQSSRLLLLHLTDIKNTQTKYANPRMNLLEKNGNLPHLVRSGKANIILNSSHKTAPKVWALDVTGKRLGLVEWKDNGFVADTVGKHGAVMAYEIVWKD